MSAIDQARQVNDIGFAEFTMELINSVFDGILAANMEQTETFLKLVGTLRQDVSEFVRETEGDVTDDEVLGLIDKVPALVAAFGLEGEERSDSEVEAALDPAGEVSLDAAALGDINKALSASAYGDAIANVVGAAAGAFSVGADAIYAKDAPVYDPDAEAPDLSAVSKAKLLDAIAQKISADKFGLLQEMVKLGMLRLVVDNGMIQTRLVFKTMDKTTHRYSVKDKTRRKSKDSTRTRGRLTDGNDLFRRGRGRHKTKNKFLNVRTAKESDVAKEGTSVDIFARVELHFHTDYLPVSQA